MFEYPKSILIVDDQPIVQQVFQFGLQALGYRCATANHGLEALETLRVAPFEVILTDLQMPHMDGLELCRQISRDPSLGHPTIIMMTGSLPESVRPLALSLGVTKIFKKPCWPSDIHQLLRTHPTKFPGAA